MARKPSATGARSGAKGEKSEKRGATELLPIPEPIVRHHGPTLAAHMREWVARKRVPPVLLITGTAGSAKRQLGYWLAQWILCERTGFSEAKPAGGDGDDSETDMFGGALFGAPDEASADPEETERAASVPDGDPAPCGECSACQRALNGNWVDFSEILPDDADPETGGGGSLKVDQFRKIKSTLGFGAHEGAYRIVLIPNADRMTVQAANSVLKLLEEPPPGWIFFLTASDPTLVLPTILSRCQALRVRPFPAPVIRELLAQAGVDPERAAICAELAQGSWAKALALAGPEAWDHRDAIFLFLREPSAQLTALVDWASGAPAHFDLLLDQLEQLSSELIRWTVSPDAARPENYPWINVDGRISLSSHAKAVTNRLGGLAAAREFWIGRANRIAELRQQSLAPLNRKILLQDLLLPWLNSV